MQRFKFSDSPIEVHGLPFYGENGKLERIPDGEIEKFPRLSFLGKRTPGARLCFRTNSENLTVKATFETLTLDVGMSLFGCQSFSVMVGNRGKERFAGITYPKGYVNKIIEKTFKKTSDEQEVTIFFPRNERIADVEIGIDDGAILEAPTPYRYGPILYYGSSITEGGCCQRATNAYNALLSSWLDVDYYNYGFSGSAMGETEMAELINRIPMSAFVLDYDHNAPSTEHLRKTHEPFFKAIREAHPDMPIVMLSAPVYTQGAEWDRRAEVVRATYENAVKSGDKNVWHIDGRTYFGENGELCSCDGIHPNDLGFYFMAKAIYPVLKQALEKTEGNLNYKM